MKKQKPHIPTTAKGVRLPNVSWPKLNELLKLNGRSWLVRLIEREHKKMIKNKFANPLKKCRIEE